MIRISKEKVLLLHQLLAEATGGSVGVRDQGLLDSALEGPLPALAIKASAQPSKRRARGLSIR